MAGELVVFEVDVVVDVVVEALLKEVEEVLLLQIKFVVFAWFWVASPPAP